VPPTTHTPRLTPAFSRVLVLLFLSVFINYIDRSNLSIAAPLLKDEIGISASQLGILLSAFFWTYSSCQLLSGWLVDRFDVKWVFAGGFFLWSSATAVTGFVHSLVLLLVVRVILGAGESVAYPGYSKILAMHCPEQHRGFANAVVAAGLSLGPSFGLLFGGTLVAHFGWRPFFIGLGFVSLLWLLPWMAWMPATDMTKVANRKDGPGVWAILQQRSAWGTCVGLFCANYCLYFMVTWLPFYLQRERNLSITAMAKVGGGMFLMAALSAGVSGWVSDRWTATGASPTLVRKTFMIAGAVAAGIFLLCTVVLSGTAGIVFLMLAGVAFGLTASNMWVITQRLAGTQAVGRWCGLQLFVGNSSGVVAPAVTGFLLDRTGHFFWPFLIVCLILWIGGLSWVFIVGPIEPVDWNRRTTTLAAKVPAYTD
jgi:MFS transporter, ACS family, D-galactonate transporter